MISNPMNNIQVINNMNLGNGNNPKINHNNPSNNSNNNINNVNSNNNNMQIAYKSNNMTNIKNPQNNTLNKNNNNNMIFLTFTFKKYNKQIFIDVLENILFSQVIKELEDKYNWLKKIKNKLYYLDGNELDKNKYIKDLGIKDNSDITVII
jgi:hypothetical protein